MTWYYTEKILDTIRKLPEFTNEFGKVAKLVKNQYIEVCFISVH